LVGDTAPTTPKTRGKSEAQGAPLSPLLANLSLLALAECARIGSHGVLGLRRCGCRGGHDVSGMRRSGLRLERVRRAGNPRLRSALGFHLTAGCGGPVPATDGSTIPRGDLPSNGHYGSNYGLR
jgi:hypothetical protein